MTVYCDKNMCYQKSNKTIWGIVVFMVLLILIIAIGVYFFVYSTSPENAFTRTNGKWVAFTCNTDSCFGFNEATIYGVQLFEPVNPDTPLKSAIINLKFNQAIIITGLTPPNCLYWGITAYIYRRKFADGTFSTEYNASITDTLNQRTFEYAYPGVSPFSQKFVVVSSRNPDIVNEIINSEDFKRDFADSYLFLLPIPTDAITNNDELIYVSRATYIENSTDLENYVIDTRMFSSLLTFRNVDTTYTKGNKYCYVEPGYEPTAPECVFRDNNGEIIGFYQKPRVTDINENRDAVLKQNYIQFVANILRPIVGQFTLTYVPVIAFSKSIEEPNQDLIIDTGYNCIEFNYDCLFDTRDTVYSLSSVIETENALDVLIFGVDHTKTGKAVYVNINVYDYFTLTPFFDLLVEIAAGQDYYYISLNDVVPKYKEYSKIVIAERAYLQTDISADFATLITPSVVVVSPL